MAKKKNNDTQSIPEIFPLLVLEDVVVLPGLPQPVKIEDEKRIAFIHKSFSERRDIVTGWLSKDDKVSQGHLMRYGMQCRIDKVLQVPGMPTLAFLLPISKVSISEVKEDPKENDIIAICFQEPPLKSPSRELKSNHALEERLNDLFNQLLNFIPEPERKNAEMMIADFKKDPANKIYAMAHVAPINSDERYKILECNTYSALLSVGIMIFDQALQRIVLQASIHEKTHRELSQQQKEAFLRMHLKTIQEELGDNEDENDITELLKTSSQKKWKKEASEHFNKEIGKLKRLNISNPEYSVQYSYLETLLALPWENYNHKVISINKAEETLDKDHFGLEKVKERILEYLSVLKLSKNIKAPIICLVGPPGVGKTSIGKSVAEALGREYVRISLGGVHDEAEIRGHRRTYIGAMPGRFLQALTKCKTGNPLILLDEIDKVGKDYKGDPSSALLEALDPEQNNSFHDNFIDFPYDLSKVLFIATANDISTIPSPLLDRMEVIEMNGYIPEEKKEIALRHLVKKSLLNNGFQEEEITFTPESIDHIIRFYTREAGVRQLEKKIGKTLRKIARLKATKKTYPTIINIPDIEKYLGKHEIDPESYETNEFAGVATGLAWTPAGGDILFIETSVSPGKGDKLTMTGNLGNVMKESATLALQYIKSHPTETGIDAELLNKVDIHLHVPEGAVPKDGPSAGITIATSIVSALTGKRLRDRTAMTGELTLRGKVMPVGGIKEKIIAAKNAGIQNIILSLENKKDIDEISPQYLEGINFIYVKTLDEVLEAIVLPEEAPRKYLIS